MTSTARKPGIIILGNSGAGKSFLGNVILNREAFEHEYQMQATTVKTEYQECILNQKTYAVYNIPGLIELDQERIDINIQEIDKAFQQHPYAVVMYVFGTTNGKIRNEDIVAFHAINSAYPLSEKSLIIIVNSLSPNRKADYESQTTSLLTQHFKMNLPYICYVNEISHENEKQPLRQQLIQTITTAMPKTHEKQHEIELVAAQLQKLIKQVAEFQNIIEKQQNQIDEQQKVIEDYKRQKEATENERQRKEYEETKRQQREEAENQRQRKEYEERKRQQREEAQNQRQRKEYEERQRKKEEKVEQVGRGKGKV
ncbi:unnamed protein product [Didymodactylos carnosus]|uniref:AIG1-type G domain-containing protein n=1 Tax=Didymodactylos carnosus TaxID=1234261 RepID=A0A815AXX3_9BILA|nr:unnamed protein product [Didymodactylos carnosus]CAF4048919.1 unnamed protein product [Didymodactylos carnosus]